MSDIELDGPKHRIEHASSGQATCQQAACKRSGSKIVKGELRVGTNTLFNRDDEMRWYMAWRHWACATPHQIRGLKELAANDATQVPGYDRLSPESQEQLRLTFEEGRVADKEFKGIRPDLAGPAPLSDGCEILDAEGYKIDMPSRAAGCRASGCGSKVVKGELRVGFLRSFDGEHSNWVYKHWNCISKYDINALISCYEQDNLNSLDGLETIPDTFKQAVMETMRTGERVDVTKEEAPAAKAKKARAKKSKIEEQDSTADEAPKRTRSRKKRPAKDIDTHSDPEPEYVPKKSRSRSKPKEEPVDPAIAKIEAMAAAMRDNAASR